MVEVHITTELFESSSPGWIRVMASSSCSALLAGSRGNRDMKNLATSMANGGNSFRRAPSLVGHGCPANDLAQLTGNTERSGVLTGRLKRIVMLIIQQENIMEIEDVINTAELWQAGKMIGGDEEEVRNALLDEVKKLRKENKHFDTIEKLTLSIGAMIDAKTSELIKKALEPECKEYIESCNRSYFIHEKIVKQQLYLISKRA